MKLFYPLALILCCASGVSCTSGNLPNYNLLGDLRILTLKADHPEVNAGDAVTLTALISDINGGTRTLTWTAQGCPDPGVGLGASPTCGTTPDNLGSGTISFGADPKKVRTTEVPLGTFNVPAAPVIFALQSSVAQFNGVSYLVFYTVTASDGATVSSFKRIIVSTRTQKNQNPTLTDVQSNGVVLPAAPLTSTLPTGVVTLTPDEATSSAETYPAQKSDGSTTTQTEQLTLTWFYSDGTMNRIRTQNSDANTWTAPATPPSNRGVILVTVLHDGRGGESYVISLF